MKTVIFLALAQAALGAFDTLYYHEYKLRLPKTTTAVLELRLHASRDFLYALIFLSFAWLEWHGLFALVFSAFIAAEIFITLWDFVEEDLTRKLPAGERVMHTVMAIIYGALLANLIPIVFQWWEQDSGMVRVDYGYFSLLLSLLSVGVFGSGVRDLLASMQMRKA